MTDQSIDLTQLKPNPQPSHLTLYVRNLNESISKSRLSYVLNKLFSRYGTVANIQMRKGVKMKGQAFVTLENRTACEKSLTKLQGYPVFKRQIQISFAKSSSDAYLNLIGDLKELDKRKEDRDNKRKEQLRSLEEKKNALSEEISDFTKSQLKLWKHLPPNKVLLLQNLPANYLDSERLGSAFEKFAGYEKVRLIKFRKLAFIDFELEQAATLCLSEIDLTLFGDCSLLTYAKK